MQACRWGCYRQFIEVLGSQPHQNLSKHPVRFPVEDNVGNEIVISTLVVGNPQSFIPYLGNTLRYATGC